MSSRLFATRFLRTSALASHIQRRSFATFYAASHEWVSVEGDIGTVGITDHAQSALGDIVYVDFPEVGDTFTQEGTFGAIESTKAASDLYSPISGEVVEVNETIESDGEYGIINTDAESSGWLIKVKLSDAR